MKMLSRDKNPEKAVKLYLEDTEDGVVLMAEDSKGDEWSILIVTNDGIIERSPYITSEDFVTESTINYVKIKNGM